MRYLHLAAVLVLAVGAAAQSLVEVVARGVSPSVMLDAQIEKGEDEFVLYDTGYEVRELVITMVRQWAAVEKRRMRHEREFLAALQAVLEVRTEAEAMLLRPVVAVARSLLDTTVELPPGPCADERADLVAARVGRMRFAPGTPVFDWGIARPNGAYSRRDLGLANDLAGFFRAMVYLQQYCLVFDDAQRRLWSHAAEGLAKDVADSSRQVGQVLGGEPMLPGIPGPCEIPDLELLLHRAASGDPLQAIGEMFTLLAAEQPASVRGAVLSFTHACATEATDAPFFAPLGAQRWQEKWRGAGAFAYVGLRAIDGLAAYPVGMHAPSHSPRVIIEPAPRIWAAIAELRARLAATHVEPGPPGSLESVLHALSVQEKGEELPAELEASLLRGLRHGFDQADPTQDTDVRIAPFAGTFRRRAPELVRIPVQWRGKTVKALALRLAAEFVPDAPRPTVTLSLRFVPTGAYTLHIVHESGAVVDVPGTASGEHTLALPPGPCTLHVLRADGSEFAQRVFKVGDTAPQAVELDLRAR